MRLATSEAAGHLTKGERSWWMAGTQGVQAQKEERVVGGGAKKERQHGIPE